MLLVLHFTGLSFHLADGVDRLQLILLQVLSPSQKRAILQRSQLLWLLQLLLLFLLLLEAEARR